MADTESPPRGRIKHLNMVTGNGKINSLNQIYGI